MSKKKKRDKGEDSLYMHKRRNRKKNGSYQFIFKLYINRRITSIK